MDFLRGMVPEIVVSVCVPRQCAVFLFRVTKQLEHAPEYSGLFILLLSSSYFSVVLPLPALRSTVCCFPWDVLLAVLRSLLTGILLVKGGRLEFGAPTGKWVLIIVYRGKHCPVSKNYLASLQQVIYELDELGKALPF